MTCQKCSRFSYFGSESGICQRCHQKQAKLADLKKRYKIMRSNPNRTLGTTFDVIQLYWREKLSVAECAEVLEITENEVYQHIDIARQDAE